MLMYFLYVTQVNMVRVKAYLNEININMYITNVSVFACLILFN